MAQASAGTGPQPYDHRVDLFAFGILIHEVVHGGARLFPQVASGVPGALTTGKFATAVAEHGLRPAWHHPDEDLGALARRCLSHDPAQRPEFAEILRRGAPDNASVIVAKLPG